MEKDTVILSLEKYNELRDFKRNVEEGKVVSFMSYNPFNDYWSKRCFLTENEALKKVQEINQDLKKQLTIFKNRTEKLIENENKPKELSIAEIKNMSYWQLIKWKRNENKF